MPLGDQLHCLQRCQSAAKTMQRNCQSCCAATSMPRTLSRWSECSSRPAPAPSFACTICALSAFQLRHGEQAGRAGGRFIGWGCAAGGRQLRCRQLGLPTRALLASAFWPMPYPPTCPAAWPRAHPAPAPAPPARRGSPPPAAARAAPRARQQQRRPAPAWPPPPAPPTWTARRHACMGATGQESRMAVRSTAC